MIIPPMRPRQGLLRRAAPLGKDALEPIAMLYETTDPT
jgi:hypothetical protein